MKILKYIGIALAGTVLTMSCNKPHDKSYTSGTFTGESNIKKYLLVDDVLISDTNYTESGSTSLLNVDSLIFNFTSSIYSAERTFKATPTNIYEYISNAEKIVDRFDVKDNGDQMWYYGTRKLEATGSDTARFYEINFIGKRD